MTPAHQVSLLSVPPLCPRSHEIDQAAGKLAAVPLIGRALLPTSRTALDLFCAFLGSIAGDVALTFGARAGVYIARGIAPRILDFLERSEFRARFEAKGASRSYVESIPTHVIVHPETTFVGLQALAQQSR